MTDSIVVCALYRFVQLPDYQELQAPLKEVLEANEIKGTLLLAKEGINGTVAGSREGIDALLAWFQNDPRLAGINYKESYDSVQPFLRPRVRLKKEIVTMGVENIDPNKIVGTYVKPKDWNQLISDPNVVLVDTRNDYEFEIGTFKNALNPETKTFREFPEYVNQNLDQEKHKKVAMFCTGGIRCEKATAYLKEQGFDEVFHLEGGILKYLEEVPQEESLWEGECFVFDNRVSVDHQLEKGSYELCFACRQVVSEEDKKSELYTYGQSCPKCAGSISGDKLEAVKERARQVELAKARGEIHIGSEVSDQTKQRRVQKQAQREADRKLHAELSSQQQS